MIFDKLCGVAERHMPSMMPILDRCALFHFPGYPHEVLPDRFTGFTEEEGTFLWEDFHLPFPYMAVEDENSVVAVWEEAPDQVGLGGVKRYAMEAMSMTSDRAMHTGDDTKVGQKVREGADKLHARHGEFLLITMGVIEGHKLIDPVKFRTEFRGSVSLAFTANKKAVIQSPKTLMSGPMSDDFLARGFVRNVRACLEEIIWFNSPDRFVVKDTPTKGKVAKGKVARSNQRPTYSLLTPAEIRDKYGMGAGQSTTGRTKQGHTRRGHWRRYRAERFSEEVRKKPRWIQAMWVGDTETVKGAHRYEVMLDV